MSDSELSQFASEHERMMYLLAEHLLNPKGIGLPAWAARGCELLVEVQRMDPAKYSEHVSKGREVLTEVPQ